MSGEGNAPSSLSYATLQQSLAAIGQKLSKNKRTMSKLIPQATADMEQLIFALKQHNMHRVSSSSRVAEAQAWANKAVIDKHANRPEDEAQSYLCAANIWFHIERERKSVNFPTTDDCLARGVSCCAMACSVLLSQRPNVASSPLPRRMQAKQQMPNIHLSRCWAICMKVATVLTEFNCLEMAADYYELAAVVVTVDQPLSSSLDGPAINASLAGSSGGDNNNINSPQGSFASAGPRGKSPPPQAAPASFANNASFTSHHTDPAAGGGNYSGIGDGTESTGGGGGGGGGGPSPARSTVTRTTARGGQQWNFDEKEGGGTNVTSSRSTKSQVVPGLLANYLIAMVHAAQTCCLVQDYPRALTMADEVLVQLAGMERSRRPTHVVAGWGTEGVTSVALQLDDANSSSTQQQQPIQELQRARVSETGSATGTDTANNANAALSREASSLPTTVPASETAPTTVGPAAAAATATAITKTGGETAPSPLPLNHLHFMLETEYATIQMRVLKFLLLLVIRDKHLTIPGALEQIAGLSQMAQLYARHERTTKMPPPRSTDGKRDEISANRPAANHLGSSDGGGGVAAALRCAALKLRAAAKNNSSSANVSSAPSSASPQYIRSLVTLRTSMEIILDVYESYVTSSTPQLLEAVLAQAVEEMHGSMAQLGARTRDVMILVKRAEESILRSNISPFEVASLSDSTPPITKVA